MLAFGTGTIFAGRGCGLKTIWTAAATARRRLGPSVSRDPDSPRIAFAVLVEGDDPRRTAGAWR